MATLFAVNHYTEMARQARAMAPDVSKRPAFDPDYGAYTGHAMDPRSPCECCDEVMTEDEARGEAQDQILSVADSTSDWLAKECNTDAGRLPKDVRHLTGRDFMEATPATCWATLLTGNDAQIRMAAHRLRDLALVDHGDLIKLRASEILAGQE